MLSKNNSTSSLLLMLGNPGTGKSTLLNALIGKVVFRSGVSFGRGMTLQFQLYRQGGPNDDDDDDDNEIHDGTSKTEQQSQPPPPPPPMSTSSNNSSVVYYGDTPGLSDVTNRPNAAAEISKALQQAVEMNHHQAQDEQRRCGLKLIFVCRLQAGRVCAEDVTTMKLVLNALLESCCSTRTTTLSSSSSSSSCPGPLMMLRYGIIVNQVSPALYALLRDDDPSNQTAIDARQQIMASLNTGIITTSSGSSNTSSIPPTLYIHYYPRINELEDVDDALHEPQDDLQDFIDLIPVNENLFSCHHQPQQQQQQPEPVVVVQAANFHETQMAVQAKLQTLHHNPQAVMEEMHIHQTQLELQALELQQQAEEEFQAQVKELKQKYQHRHVDDGYYDDDDDDDDKDKAPQQEEEAFMMQNAAVEMQRVQEHHAVQMTKIESLVYFAFGAGSVLAGAAAFAYGKRQVGATLVITGVASITNAVCGQK